jgi:hypothetical protein
MANKAVTNLSIKCEYLKEANACYKNAYESLLQAVGNFAQDNPDMDLMPLGHISADISNRLKMQLQKAEMKRTKY